MGETFKQETSGLYLRFYSCPPQKIMVLLALQKTFHSKILFCWKQGFLLEKTYMQLNFVSVNSISFNLVK